MAACVGRREPVGGIDRPAGGDRLPGGPASRVHRDSLDRPGHRVRAAAVVVGRQSVAHRPTLGRAAAGQPGSDWVAHRRQRPVGVEPRPPSGRGAGDHRRPPARVGLRDLGHEHDRVRALVLGVRSRRTRPAERRGEPVPGLPVPADAVSRAQHRPSGSRRSSTTCTCRSPTRPRSARPMFCRCRSGRSSR